MRLNFPITIKLSMLVVIMVIVTALAVNEVYLRGSNKILVERAMRDLEQEAAFFRYPLDGILNQLQDDVRLLSQLQATGGLMRATLNNGVDPVDRSTGAQWNDRLATTFEEMLRTREHYRRIRFIGVADGGREILRVERLGNEIERRAKNKLQQVNHETFFRNTLYLAPGDIYLSDIELNRDEGKLTTPHLLVMRAVVPVFTPDKKIFGMISVNVDFGKVLASIRHQSVSNHTLYVANATGDYLVHPDPTYLYATDLGHDHRLQRDYPELLDMIGAQHRDTATVLAEGVRRGHVLAFQKYRYDRLNPEQFLSIAVEAQHGEIIKKTADVGRQGMMFSLVIAALAAVIAVISLRYLMRPLNRVADAVVRYRKGEKNMVLPVESPDEIGVLAKEFAAMMRQKGDEDWIKENLVSIARNLLGFKDLQAFANALMAAITPSVSASVGVLYVNRVYAEKYVARDVEELILLGSYGYAGTDTLPVSFRIGEGQVGQCAQDKKPILLSNMPRDYLRVVSALGNTKPLCILLLPVLFENTLVGVIEIGSLHEFTPTHRAFLEQMCFNVGVLVNSISAGQRTEELLEETRMTAEELQRSEEELKTQQEELQASNEELEEKTRALEEQNAQIRHQSKELTLSTQVIEEKARELELANKYKSEFLANMSHELRTPLNSLLILARSLASNEEGNLTDEQVEEAHVIHNGGLELLSLINDILDLSKVEAGKLNIIAEDTLLDDIIKRLQQQFDPVAKESGLAFYIKKTSDVPLMVHTDAQRVEQIMKNLLSNAFKFTSEGSVTLEVRRPDAAMLLQRDSLDSAEAIAFSVTDTGIGIEASKLKDIFEAFQQEDGSTDRHYGGTGLGLTIARKFAHMLGGEIHVSSEKGKGSVFTLILPTTLVQGDRVEDAPAAADVVASSAGDSKRIELKSMPRTDVTEFIADDRRSIGSNDKVLLVIEDDRNFSATLMKIARKRGYKCLAAGDGKTGMLLAVEQPVTAIILDLKLPDIDGINVLDHLKHDLRTRHIPVHIISATEEKGNVLPLRKGAIGYLTKPVEKEDIDGVFSKIENLLSAEMKKILVVEDDKKNQVAIQSLLKKKDIQITVASRGEQALEKISHTRFDCIILDLRLPDMTGFDWLEKMEQDMGDTTPPPVIIYTAKELTEEENRRLNRHTGSIIIKGAKSPERLLDEVTLFLHSVESTLSRDQQDMIRMQHDPDKTLQNRTVLLVDDDLRNTFALSKLLKKHGMNVVIADNGQMAIEKLKSDSSIELVIMDIMMPVMDGYQAMREIRAQKPYQNLPMIALTARAMPEEQEKCMAAGANDYLTKPVDIERLLTLLRVWLFKQEAAA